MNQINNRNQLDVTKFENFVSLGHNCYVAEDLKKLGLRNYSLPFDWLFSRWKGVMLAIDSHFKDFLKYKYLYQQKSAPYIYKNVKYDIYIVHDFKKEIPLLLQLRTVTKKYKRRIERFFDTIKHPTLFIRYVETEMELDDIIKNYSKIVNVFKSYNKANELLCITHFNNYYEKTNDIPYMFFIDQPDTEEFSMPILRNAELHKTLSGFEYKNKNKNIKFVRSRDTSFNHRFYNKFIKNKRTYIHYRQID